MFQELFQRGFAIGSGVGLALLGYWFAIVFLSAILKVWQMKHQMVAYKEAMRIKKQQGSTKTNLNKLDQEGNKG